MSSAAPFDDGGHGSGGLLWALRRYARLLVLTALLVLGATAAAVAIVLSRPVEYTATASVLASRLVHSPTELSRIATTVGTSDGVLREALRRGELDYTADELRDRYSEIRPLEDNVLILVDGFSTEPATAERTANALASALASGLNQGGEGIGDFRVLNPAIGTEPQQRVVRVAVMIAGGLVATVAVVLAVAGLLLSTRRPVTSPRDAAASSGLPVLAVMERASTGSPPGSDAAAALLEALAARGVDRVVVSAPSRSWRARQAVARRLAEAMARRGSVTYVAPKPDARQLREPFAADGVMQASRDEVAKVKGRVVVDGVLDEKTAESVRLPSGAHAVVVVEEGAPRRQVMTCLDRFADDARTGVVFVRR